MKNFKKLLYLTNRKERMEVVRLLTMILIMGLLDMIGVASILPLIMLLTDPAIIETNLILNLMFEFFKKFGIENSNQFLIVLVVTMFFLLVISISFKAITTYVQTRFVYMQEYNISKRLLENYLKQPYSWFLSHHSSDLGKNILSEVSQVIGNGIKPLIELISKCVITIAIIFLLILVDPKLALIVGLSIGVTYLLIFYFIKSFLNKIGVKRLSSNKLRFLSLNNVFGAIKEIKLAGLEKHHINLFSEPAYDYAKTTSDAIVAGQLPRFFLEIIAFGGVLLLMLYLMNVTGEFNKSLPLISLYVFAGYRLIPSLQQIYNSFTQLTFVGPSLDSMVDQIKSLQSFTLNTNQNTLQFNKLINLRNIEYTYPKSQQVVLKDININIFANKTVGLIGTTGSGKTTLVDIILGLLEPKKGFLEIDGIAIDKNNLRSWQSMISYVPQNIFLLDNTITANIAFGIDPEKVDLDAVLKASKIANIHNFIQEELPNKYSTIVGERGVRLSGGQIQRIGIARALYHNPKVLILDEATSALDSHTEQQVMDAINNLSKNLTIIIIAHRVNTMKNYCDIIYKLEKGKIIEQGKFDKIIKL